MPEWLSCDCSPINEERPATAAERSSMGKSWCLGNKDCPSAVIAVLPAGRLPRQGHVTREPSSPARSAPGSWSSPPRLSRAVSSVRVSNAGHSKTCALGEKIIQEKFGVIAASIRKAGKQEQRNKIHLPLFPAFLIHFSPIHAVAEKGTRTLALTK
jgi:hypothetical protein